MSGGAGGTMIENLELGLLYAAMILSPKVCLGFAERPVKENKCKISKSFHTRFFFFRRAHLFKNITEMRKCKSFGGEFKQFESFDEFCSYWQLAAPLMFRVSFSRTASQ